jgi:dTDP-4-dehydrorhamnose reductase
LKIVITGCNGQVGWELARSLLPLGDVITLTRNNADLANFTKLRDVIKHHAPDVIVNPAAYTAVDKAETETELAFKINAEAPGVIAEEAKKLGALFVHYSTDYVFDGIKSLPYLETDNTNAINVYGQSKLAGEQTIQSVGGDYLLLRTSWVYASRGSNFLKTILRLAAERDELRIVADQIGSPTWARVIAGATAHIVKQSVMERKLDQFYSDIYHLTCKGSTSWHGFAEQIVHQAKLQGQSHLKASTIHPIATTDYPLPAKRPANSLLATTKLEQHFGLSLPSWDNSLKLCLEGLL